MKFNLIAILMIALLGSCERKPAELSNTQDTISTIDPEAHYLLGSWRGKSQSYAGREYTWELRLLGTSQFSLAISGGKIESAEHISGKWRSRSGGLTLFPENNGTEMFSFPARESESNDGEIGYHARISELEPDTTEFWFECCDFAGQGHRVKARKEQAGTGQPATRPESKSEGSIKPQPESKGRSR
jgi:hypothetical protein